MSEIFEPDEVSLPDRSIEFSEKLTELPDKRTNLSTKRTMMAAKRTLMAAERSLMAWIRTGLSMIGFGFTLFKFLQFMQEEGKSLTLAPEGPRRIGLLLMGLGIFTVLLGSMEYWNNLLFINKEFDVPKRKFPLIMAGAIILLGLFLFISVIAKIKLI